MTEIFSIGHSTSNKEEFIDLLKTHNITTLADVRSMPGSNRYPHFNSGNMALWLNDSNISYHHIPELGGRRRVAGDSYANIKTSGFKAYAQYSNTDTFRQGIIKLLQLPRPLAFMCAEAVWWRCHRRIIAEYLDICFPLLEVRHIMPNGSLQSVGQKLLREVS